MATTMRVCAVGKRQWQKQVNTMANIAACLLFGAFLSTLIWHLLSCQLPVAIGMAIELVCVLVSLQSQWFKCSFFFFLILLLLLPTTSALFYNFTFRKSSLCSYVAFSFSRSHLARFSFHLSGACIHTYIHSMYICVCAFCSTVCICRSVYLYHLQ